MKMKKQLEDVVHVAVVNILTSDTESSKTFVERDLMLAKVSTAGEPISCRNTVPFAHSLHCSYRFSGRGGRISKSFRRKGYRCSSTPGPLLCMLTVHTQPLSVYNAGDGPTSWHTRSDRGVFTAFKAVGNH